MPPKSILYAEQPLTQHIYRNRANILDTLKKKKGPPMHLFVISYKHGWARKPDNNLTSKQTER